MARPLRLEFPGAIYHVTSRGDRREPIYRGDVDRRDHLAVLAEAMERFDAAVLAYCLMGNHYHLVLLTRQGNLSRLMRHLNGVYTQRFNGRHRLVGHLFQGRYKAILVDADAYLVTLCRYVECNPVAARMVAAAEDWPWSSCRAHLGLEQAPGWLDTRSLGNYLLGRSAVDDQDLARAAAIYAELVHQKVGDPIWRSGLTAQVFMGDADFAARMQQRISEAARHDPEIPKTQRRRPLDFAQCLRLCQGDRANALRLGYVEGGLTMTELARQADLSVSRVSRLIRAGESSGGVRGKT